MEVNYVFKKWTILTLSVMLVFTASIVVASHVAEADPIPDSSSGSFSESNRLQFVVDVDFPTTDSNLVCNWVTSPINCVTTNSGETWKLGSTPLIVGDYVYVACQDLLFKYEASTGALVEQTERLFGGAKFYHYLGYGDGYIISYDGGEIFDIDLNRVGYIDSNIEASWYNEGYFYGLFKNDDGSLDLKKFTIMDNEGQIGIEYYDWAVIDTQWLYIEGTYSTPVFSESCMFYISVSTTIGVNGGVLPYKIFLNSVVLNNGNRNTLDLDLDYRYLDDGWLTINGNKIYVPTYVSGLFDESSVDNKSAITQITVDSNGQMVKDFDKYLDYSGVCSNFIVYNNRGYINVCHDGALRNATFYVFDMETFSENSKPEYTVASIGTHGGIVLNSHYSGDGGKVYVYFVPYNPSQGSGPVLCHVMDYPGKTTGGMTSYTSAGIANASGYNYSSQGVRFTDDGYAIFFRDLGQIICLSGASSSQYYVLLQNGNEAIWTTFTESELTSGDVGGITFSDGIILGYTLNGNTIADDFSLYYYNDLNGWVDTGNKSISKSSGSSYETMNTRPGSSHYLVLSNNGVPAKTDIFYDSNGEEYTLNTFLSDKSVVGLLLNTDGIEVSFVPDYTIPWDSSEQQGPYEFEPGTKYNIDAYSTGPINGFSTAFTAYDADDNALTAVQISVTDVDNVGLQADGRYHLHAAFTITGTGDVSYVGNDDLYFDVSLAGSQPAFVISYNMNVHTVDSGSMRTYTLTISRVSGNINIDDARLLVIADYGGVFVNVYSKIDLDANGDAVETVRLSTTGLTGLTFDIVEGFPAGAYTAYGTLAPELS